MTDPSGFFLLLALAVFAVSLAVVGLRRGKVVGIFDWRREVNPALFWYGVIFQIGLGLVCLVLALMKVFH